MLNTHIKKNMRSYAFVFCLVAVLFAPTFALAGTPALPPNSPPDDTPSGSTVTETPPIKFKPNVAIPGSEFLANKFVTVSPNMIARYINAIYYFLVSLAGVLALAVIVFAGFSWVQAGGNAEKIKSAQGQITGALMGLFLTLFSYTLMQIVNPDLLSMQALGSQYVTGEEQLFLQDFDGVIIDNNGNIVSYPEQISKSNEGASCDGVRKVDQTNLNASTTTGYLQKDAATQFEKMAAAFQAKFKAPLPASSLFRDFATQVCLYCGPCEHKSTPAAPCSSPHEKGIAIDITITALSQAQYNWIACGKEESCSSSSGRLAKNSYGFELLNYDPGMRAKVDKGQPRLDESHHLTYKDSSVTSIADVCAKTSCSSATAAEARANPTAFCAKYRK